MVEWPFILFPREPPNTKYRPTITSDFSFLPALVIAGVALYFYNIWAWGTPASDIYSLMIFMSILMLS